MKTTYVYIATNLSRTLYFGVTNNLERRVYEHKHKLIPGFTAHYNIGRLVFYEELADPLSVIEREKVLKGWRRQRKIDLIDSLNPGWNDLTEFWE